MLITCCIIILQMTVRTGEDRPSVPTYGMNTAAAKHRGVDGVQPMCSPALARRTFLPTLTTN